MRNVICLVYALARKGAVRGARKGAHPDPFSVRIHAVLVLTCLEWLVLVGAIVWVKVLGGPYVLDAASKPLIAVVFGGMVCVNYVVTVRYDEQWKEFDERSCAQPPALRRRGTLLAAAIIAGALVFVVLAFVVAAHQW